MRRVCAPAPLCTLGVAVSRPGGALQVTDSVDTKVADTTLPSKLHDKTRFERKLTPEIVTIVPPDDGPRVGVSAFKSSEGSYANSRVPSHLFLLSSDSATATTGEISSSSIIGGATHSTTRSVRDAHSTTVVPNLQLQCDVLLRFAPRRITRVPPRAGPVPGVKERIVGRAT